MKILVVEDEKKVARLIKRGLEEVNYSVTVAYNGHTGFKLAMEGDYKLVILDLTLPKKDGLDIIKELREVGNHVPVLMLTARVTTDDIIAGLNAGADDYLKKPFVFIELVSRVRALLRRSEHGQGAEVNFVDLRLNPVSHKIWRGETEIQLTGQEYTLLEYMMRNPNKVVSRAMIAENCWDYELDTFNNIIDIYVSYLRKKVDMNSPTKLIHTVRGQGYVLREE